MLTYLVQTITAFWSGLRNIIIVHKHWPDTHELHGPMHYKIGVTCVYNGHVLYTPL